MIQCILCKKDIAENALLRIVKAMGNAALCELCNAESGAKLDEFFSEQLKKAQEFVQNLITEKQGN